jgi:hypothetical protein
MSLRFNLLSGTIPDSVPFENLQGIYLSFNMMSGSIPESLFSPSLEALVLWENSFSGSLSSRIGDLVQMHLLDLTNNDLTGTIPSAIGALNMLGGLYLDGNSFRGTIPSELGLLTGLWDGLWLSDNQLSGTVPVELSSLSVTTLKLNANNLTGSLDMFCNQTDLLTKIDADCGGVDSAVECSCCTSCCDSLSSGYCAVNGDAVCLVEKSKFVKENGPEYYESGGTVCECTTGSNSTSNVSATLSCMDTESRSCNQDGTVCSINERYQYTYDETGHSLRFHSTFQYVVGRNDTVTLDLTVLPDYTFLCEVTVNGQVCNVCFYAICLDQFSGIMVDCENVEEAGIVDVCNPRREDADGPLTVFVLQDPTLLQGCPPRTRPVGFFSLFLVENHFYELLFRLLLTTLHFSAFRRYPLTQLPTSHVIELKKIRQSRLVRAILECYTAEIIHVPGPSVQTTTPLK